MQSTFDERNWLVWLVRVRIFILTLLLAIELAVAQFSPGPVPMRLFISTILLWYSLSLFYVLAAFLLAGAPAAGLAAGPDRSDHGQPRGSRDRRMGQFAELPLSPGHHCGQRAAAAGMGAAGRRPGFHSVRNRAGTELLRRGSFLLHHASRHEGAAGDHLRQSVRLSGGGLSGRTAHRETAAGGRTAEGHQRRARKPAGAARKHHPLHQQRADHHRSRRPDHAGQRRGPTLAGAQSRRTVGCAGSSAVSGSFAHRGIAAGARGSPLRCRPRNSARRFACGWRP